MGFSNPISTSSCQENALKKRWGQRSLSKTSSVAASEPMYPIMVPKALMTEVVWDAFVMLPKDKCCGI